MPPLATRIGQLMKQKVIDLRPLSGGSVGEVYTVALANGQRVVAKVDQTAAPKLDIEGEMLTYLAAHSQIPVPAVYVSQPDLLLLEFLEGNSYLLPTAEQHAAELLAELHTITAAHYGFPHDTLIGGLHQPNPQIDSWLTFFVEHRLLYMGAEAVRAGRLPDTLFGRLERLVAVIERWLAEPERPSLIHGDMWTTNILAHNGRITGFLDPAIYYADAEMELAFSTLFGTFSEAFFGRYHELRPLKAGFFEERRDIYNLYPLLVHVRLFGGGYVSSVARILQKFGF